MSELTVKITLDDETIKKIKAEFLSLHKGLANGIKIELSESDIPPHHGTVPVSGGGKTF